MGRSRAESDDGLAPREREVLALLATGHSNPEIGRRLTLSTRSVESYRANAMGKLGIASTADIVKWAFHNGQLLAEGEAWDAERFLASVRQAPLMVLVADAEMRFRDASDTTLRELGYSHDELMRLSVSEIVLDRAEAERRYVSFRRAGVQWGTTTLRRKDQSTFEASYAATIRHTGDQQHYVSVLISE
jgi:PAS domain S-box-containing protein